jgi:hypothetical protein
LTCGAIRSFNYWLLIIGYGYYPVTSHDGATQASPAGAAALRLALGTKHRAWVKASSEVWCEGMVGKL